MSQETVEAFYAGKAAPSATAAAKAYKGIPMLCEDGLHETLADLAGKYVVPGQRILDVGCGQGAFSLRMHDRGYRVDACDVFDHCKCKDRVHFTCVSAEEAPLERVYDAIFMVEMIEHVEAPFALLRRYAAFLKDGGHLIVTTPNVDSDLNRAWFLLKGRHWYFEEHNVRNDGHISPVHAFQMRYIAEQLGMRVVEQASVLENRRPSFGAFWAVSKLMRLYQRARRVAPNDGKIAIYVLQK